MKDWAKNKIFKPKKKFNFKIGLTQLIAISAFIISLYNFYDSNFKRDLRASVISVSQINNGAVGKDSIKVKLVITNHGKRYETLTKITMVFDFLEEPEELTTDGLGFWGLRHDGKNAVVLKPGEQIIISIDQMVHSSFFFQMTNYMKERMTIPWGIKFYFIGNDGKADELVNLIGNVTFQEKKATYISGKLKMVRLL